MESLGALNPQGDFNYIIENAKVIEHDVQEIESKCSQMNCNPVYETIKAFINYLLTYSNAVILNPKIFN